MPFLARPTGTSWEMEWHSRIQLFRLQRNHKALQPACARMRNPPTTRLELLLSRTHGASARARQPATVAEQPARTRRKREVEEYESKVGWCDQCQQQQYNTPPRQVASQTKCDGDIEVQEQSRSAKQGQRSRQVFSWSVKQADIQSFGHAGCRENPQGARDAKTSAHEGAEGWDVRDGLGLSAAVGGRSSPVALISEKEEPEGKDREWEYRGRF